MAHLYSNIPTALKQQPNWVVWGMLKIVCPICCGVGWMSTNAVD